MATSIAQVEIAPLEIAAAQVDMAATTRIALVATAQLDAHRRKTPKLKHSRNHLDATEHLGRTIIKIEWTPFLSKPGITNTETCENLALDMAATCYELENFTPTLMK